MFQNVTNERTKRRVKIRVISLLLVIVLAVLLIPVPASATATTVTEIEQQIRTTYRRSLNAFGSDSFNGFCGSLVSWQTYCLGIDKNVYACDGNNQYDQYSRLSVTTGGYRVKSYPASRYTLKEALNAVTSNGTVDAYNIVVGFQKTNTQAGAIYGHALFVHAILDGKVYFVECYDASIAGKFWAEGEPISCTIDRFCEYYDRWTVFDGIIHFGVKTYTDLCSAYPASFYGMAMEDTLVLSEPCDEGINTGDVIGGLTMGQKTEVTGLYQTPGGSWWYELAFDGRTGYAAAQSIHSFADGAENVTVSDLRVPTNLHKGNGFALKGEISSDGVIESVQVRVYSLADPETPVLEGVLEVEGSSVSLGSKTLDKAMSFRKLAAGSYRLDITADLQSYVLQDGLPELSVENVKVWSSRFEVVTDWKTYPVVTFDGNGGAAQWNQKAVIKGGTLGDLPTAERPGYALAGWTLDAAGTQSVTSDTVITAKTTLYAQWTPENTLTNGWQQTENGWLYFRRGRAVSGWVVFEDLRIYQNGDGSVTSGWLRLGEDAYYLNEMGVMLTGWMELEDGTYYLRPDGRRATLWCNTPDGMYFFGEDGRQTDGWMIEENAYYYLNEDGSRITGWANVEGKQCLFSDDGVLLLVHENTDENHMLRQEHCYRVFDRDAAIKYTAERDVLILG